MSNLSAHRNDTVNSGDGEGFLHCVRQEILIWILSLVILVFGIVGNIVTFFKIVLNKRLHKPVSISIACLAVADFCCLCIQFIRIPLSQCSYLTDTIGKMIVLNITAASTNSSTMHIILLAAIRYCLIVHPFRTKCRLTSGKVIASSCISWIISLVLGILYGIYNRKYYNNNVDEKTDAIVQLVIGLYVLLLPVTFFLIFFIKELRTMKRSLLPKRTSKSIKAVSRMIGIILILYVVFILPYVVADTCRVLYLHHKLDFLEADSTMFDTIIIPMYSVAQIMILFNYAVNPFIYFLYSRIIFRVRSFPLRGRLSLISRKRPKR